MLVHLKRSFNVSVSSKGRTGIDNEEIHTIIPGRTTMIFSPQRPGRALAPSDARTSRPSIGILETGQGKLTMHVVDISIDGRTAIG